MNDTDGSRCLGKGRQACCFLTGPGHQGPLALGPAKVHRRVQREEEVHTWMATCPPGGTVPLTGASCSQAGRLEASSGEKWPSRSGPATWKCSGTLEVLFSTTWVSLLRPPSVIVMLRLSSCRAGQGTGASARKHQVHVMCGFQQLDRAAASSG
jgi:hypothetical protein